MKIPAHEFCQALNYYDIPLRLYWSHYQSIDSIEKFMNNVNKKGNEFMHDKVQFITSKFQKNNMEEISVTDINNIREIILKDNNLTDKEKAKLIYDCFFTKHFYSLDPIVIQKFYFSITCSNYDIGYGGIAFAHEYDTNNINEYPMRVAACFKEVKFNYSVEMLTTILKNYTRFKETFDEIMDMDAFTDH